MKVNKLTFLKHQVLVPVPQNQRARGSLDSKSGCNVLQKQLYFHDNEKMSTQESLPAIFKEVKGYIQYKMNEKRHEQWNNSHTGGVKPALTSSSW